MPTKPKARKCSWKRIFSKGKLANQTKQAASESIKVSQTSLSKKNKPEIPVEIQEKTTQCFQDWQGIVKQEVPPYFKNWQGICVGNVGLDTAQSSTMKYFIDNNFVYLNKLDNMELRRCFRNWQGIWLGFMNFDPDEAGFFRNSVDHEAIEKKPSLILTVEHVFRNSDTRLRTLEENMHSSTEPDSQQDNTIDKDNHPKHHLHRDMIQDTTNHKIKHDSATNTETGQKNQRHTKMNSYIPLKIDPDAKSIERHLELLQQEQKRKQYTDESKAALVSLVLDKNISVAQVANNANVPHDTLLSWVNFAREKRSRTSSALKPEHKQYLIEYIDENPTAVLNEALESLTQMFPESNIKKAHIQDFMKTECNIKVLKTDASSRREIKMALQNRIDWVNQLSCTDMDYMRNCIFIECTRLDVVMKSGGLPYKKSGLNVIPRYFFVALSATGILETCMFHPGIKREDPYVDFLNAILDQLDEFKELKGSYIVMNNMHAWLLDDLEKIVTNRGYQCVYFPPFCSDLNPITKFWTAVKYRINRHYLLDGETIAHRINESKDKLSESEIKDFIQHSKKYFSEHLNKPNA